MATFRGVNATKFNNVPEEKAQPGDQGGRMRVAYDSFSISAIFALNDELLMGIIPNGARVHEVVLDHDDLGTTGTATVGWKASSDGTTETEDDNGFLTSVDLNSAANTVRMTDEASVVGQFREFSAEVQAFIKFTAATTATSGDIKLAVYYTID